MESFRESNFGTEQYVHLLEEQRAILVKQRDDLRHELEGKTLHLEQPHETKISHANDVQRLRNLDHEIKLLDERLRAAGVTVETGGSEIF